MKDVILKWPELHCNDCGFYSFYESLSAKEDYMLHTSLSGNPNAKHNNITIWVQPGTMGECHLNLFVAC